MREPETYVEFFFRFFPSLLPPTVAFSSLRKISVVYMAQGSAGVYPSTRTSALQEVQCKPRVGATVLPKGP